MPVTHAFSCGIADDPAAQAAGQVLPSHWNAAHTISVNVSEINATGTPSAANILLGDGSWSNAITAQSSAAFSVGRQGGINPAFVVDSSVANSVCGIKALGNVQFSTGAALTVTSPNGNEPLRFFPKGDANVTFNTGGTNGQLKFQTNGQDRLNVSINTMSFAMQVTSGLTGGAPKFLWTANADTNLDATLEQNYVFFNINNTRSHQTGNIALQRDFRIDGTTHAFAGASTITDCAVFAVDGASVSGTNATITNASAVLIKGKAVGSGVTNSYGLNVEVNTGGTNNYVAKFAGGVIQQAPITVASLIAASTAGAGARSMVSDALAPVWGANVAGGGAVVVPVYSDGANWKVG